MKLQPIHLPLLLLSLLMIVGCDNGNSFSGGTKNKKSPASESPQVPGSTDPTPVVTPATKPIEGPSSSPQDGPTDLPSGGPSGEPDPEPNPTANPPPNPPSIPTLEASNPTDTSDTPDTPDTPNAPDCIASNNCEETTPDLPTIIVVTEPPHLPPVEPEPPVITPVPPEVEPEIPVTPPPPTVEMSIRLWADQSVILANEAVELQWTSEHADTCDDPLGGASREGSSKETLIAPEMFSLTCYRGNEKKEVSLQVQVYDELTMVGEVEQEKVPTDIVLMMDVSGSTKRYAKEIAEKITPILDSIDAALAEDPSLKLYTVWNPIDKSEFTARAFAPYARMRKNDEQRKYIAMHVDSNNSFSRLKDLFKYRHLRTNAQQQVIVVTNSDVRMTPSEFVAEIVKPYKRQDRIIVHPIISYQKPCPYAIRGLNYLSLRQRAPSYVGLTREFCDTDPFAWEDVADESFKPKYIAHKKVSFVLPPNLDARAPLVLFDGSGNAVSKAAYEVNHEARTLRFLKADAAPAAGEGFTLEYFVN